MNGLTIRNLHVSVDQKEILKGVNLEVLHGQAHVIMGPNGSGKTTLAAALMGHPNYDVTKGEMEYQGQSLRGLSSDKRARLGLFLSFQNPQEVAGVSLAHFLRQAYHALHPDRPRIGVVQFHERLEEKIGQLGMDADLIGRNVNEGFSGGEKKRAEILQLAVLEPSLAILDETDSGLDIDALKQVAAGIEAWRAPDRGFLIITHNPKLLQFLKPDAIHVMFQGRIVKSGGTELVQELEQKGFSAYGE